jgi:protein MpaA
VALLIVAIILSYVFLFVIPKNIAFAYSQNKYCSSVVTLLPSLHKQSEGQDFKLQASGGLKVGDLYLFSNQICIEPTNPPESGLIQINYSPFGGPIFRSSYIIDVGQKPIVGSAPDRPVALTKPLEFTLDQPDGLFKYLLKIGNKTSKCNTSSNVITCSIDSFGLKQGQEYSYKLARLFNDAEISDEIDGKLSLLPPVKVKKTSIKNNEMVYSLPKTFTFETSKSLTSAVITLENTDDKDPVKIESVSKITGSTVEVSIKNDLKRASKHRLTLSEASGTDGSVLDDKYVVSFQTSGGPHVSSVNVGTGGVDTNALIIVTFDQAISGTQDISKLVSFSGGSATIGRTNDQITFQLHSLAPCSVFSFRINSGLNSKYDVKSNANWSYSSRTSCRTSKVIGYSVQGRPIIAYYYGSGSTTILFTGGIHGSEYSGVYTMLDWVNHLDSNAYKIPSDRKVVIVPNTNPDGFALGSRYNANNVNLDRNFDSSNWQADIDTSTGIVVNGGGTEPMSEPETQALASLTTSLQPRLEVSFHAQGSLVGANQYGDSVSIGNLYASNVGYSSMIGVAEETMGYSITGEYEEWAGEQYGTPAILIELPTAYGSYFWSHQSTLWEMVSI